MTLLEPLTIQQEDEILAEIKYSRKQLEEDLITLKTWLEQQQHLPPSRLKEKDCFLKTFLTGCKGSLEKAKKKLDAYYTYRAYSDLFENRDPLLEEFKRKNEYNYACLMPKLTKSKALVMVNVPTHTGDYKNYNHLYNMKRIINIIEMEMRIPEMLANSIYYLIDTKHMTPSHISLLTPTVIRDMLHLIQNILPFRMKGLIFVNAPTFMEMALNNLVKPFMSKKIKDRFHIFSGGYEEFYNFVDRSILPKELGGDEERTLKQLTDLWVEKEVNERDWFLNELSERADESKRIHLDYSITDDPLFGVHGSLKKLVLD